MSLLFMFQSCENESRNLDLEGLHESIVDGSDDEDELAGSIDVSTDIEYTWSEICIVKLETPCNACYYTCYLISQSEPCAPN